MILFPAVDIKGGQAVRLRRGRADDSTVFSDDPVAAALQWQEPVSYTHLEVLQQGHGPFFFRLFFLPGRRIDGGRRLTALSLIHI